MRMRNSENSIIITPNTTIVIQELNISKDPIGLAENNPNLYAYIYDSNTMIDPFGLDIIKDA